MSQESKEGFTNAQPAVGSTEERMVRWTTQNPSSQQAAGVITMALCPDFSQIDAVGSVSADLATVQSLRQKTSYEENTGKPGVKADQGKLMWNLLPWKACEGLIKVLTFGAKKYSPNGWRSVPDARQRYLAALLRHLCAMNAGEKCDAESGLRHIDHVLTNAAFLSELEE